jgi:hypothetical protein
VVPVKSARRPKSWNELSTSLMSGYPRTTARTTPAGARRMSGAQRPGRRPARGGRPGRGRGDSPTAPGAPTAGRARDEVSTVIWRYFAFSAASRCLSKSAPACLTLLLPEAPCEKKSVTEASDSIVAQPGVAGVEMLSFAPW